MTIAHAYKNITRYKRRYGFAIGFKALIHYFYVATKKPWLNPTKQNILKVNGSRLEIMPNDPLGTSAELLMFKTHEPISTKLVSKLLKKGMVCLDIGANIGYYVQLESNLVGSTGKIIAIEPAPENFECLQKNIQLQENNNATAYNFAAGDTEGHLDFLIYENASNSGMIIRDGEKPRWPGEIIKVPVRTIDNFLDELEIGKIDFLRMDVEGYEFHIFEGMKKTLEQSKPIIHIEVHRSIMGNDVTKKWFEMLKNIGYKVKYYIPREMDTPMIGTMNDVKQYDIDELVSRMEQKKLPSFFMLSLMSE